MKIDNYVRIVDGVLQTTPAVDAFERIIFESHRILRGDCFFDKDNSQEAILEALSKGAYAVITMHQFDSYDPEIAWIHVNSIEQALIKLLRYTIAKKALVCVLASPIQISFLEMVHASKSLKILQGSLYEYAPEILKAKEHEMLCLEQTDVSSLIAPHALLIKPFIAPSPIIAKGLFMASFTYKTKTWYEQKISALFVPEFLNVLAFCDEYSLLWQCDTIALSEHFYPQFVTPNLRKKEFGSSDQVLIFETNRSLFNKELAYLRAFVSAGLISICIPVELTSLFDIPENTPVIYYKDIFDLLILREKVFQYALVLGQKENFEPLLSQSFTTQPTLF